MRHVERDAYAVLEVDPGADDRVVKSAYRALAKRFHSEGSEPDSTRMAEINGAYGDLRTPERRASYDSRQRLVAVGPGLPTEMPQADPDAGPLARRAGFDPVVGFEAARHAELVLDFGRYQGWTIPALARHDPNFLRWLYRTAAGLRFRKAIEEAMPGDPQVSRRVGLGR